jgi:hypothetical protein
MMGSTVRRIEKKTQQRVVRLFRKQLGYDPGRHIRTWRFSRAS